MKETKFKSLWMILGLLLTAALLIGCEAEEDAAPPSNFEPTLTPGVVEGGSADDNPSADEPLEANLYFVETGTAEETAANQGCNDRLVAVKQLIPSETTPIEDALTALLNVDRAVYADQGLYNALEGTGLRVDSISSADQGNQETLFVNLTGQLDAADECEKARIVAQLTATVQQFAGDYGYPVISIDGMALEDLAPDVSFIATPESDS